MEVQMTSELIKSVADKFCLEIVFILDLAGAGIRQCINLMHLNLSHNRINRIRGLSSCVELVFLDLSNNEIPKVEGLRGLVMLERLDLSANKISTLVGINDLQGLPRLRGLSFQTFGFNDTNPICRDGDYRSNLLSLLPQITSLDGQRKKSPFVNKEDFSKYETNSKDIRLNMDNRPWVGPVTFKEEKNTVDDSEVKSAIRECKSLLLKGDQILAGLR